jgi:hypothetical protein
LSSTTDRAAERGQVLVLFAGGLVALFLIAALAFDVGVMLLERRDQQNAADAAALAGARYVIGAGDYSGSCTGGTGNPAVEAACELAVANDFNDTDASENVLVHIPPLHGDYAGFPDFIEVQIDASRGSIFGGVIGRAAWPIGAMAVAANQQGVFYSFGMLALDPSECKAIHISGGGIVNSAADVQANSTGADCGDGSNIGFSRTGTSTLIVTAPDATCRTAGDLQDQGSGSMTCTSDTFSFALPDPLRNLPAPVKPNLAARMKKVVSGALDNTSTVPDYCPGATGTKAPSEASPQLCRIGLGPQRNTTWVLYPGLYPGGLDLRGGVTAYLTPGIYWIGGGGFQAADASVITIPHELFRTHDTCVDHDANAGTPNVCDGIMIYNSKLPTSPAAPIALNGNSVVLQLQPYLYPFEDDFIDLVIFQDRTVSLNGDDITLNGSGSNANWVRGIVYAPQGDVKVNGSASVFTMDQVIANTFKINGSGGTVNVLRETGVDAEIEAVGLVE